MRFIPRSVMIGFVNALGVLIFMAQVPHVLNVPWLAYVLFALTFAIIFILPRFTKVGPVAAGGDRRRHGDRHHRRTSPFRTSPTRARSPGKLPGHHPVPGSA